MLLQTDNACTMLAVVILGAVLLMDMQRLRALREKPRKREGRCGGAADCDEERVATVGPSEQGAPTVAPPAAAPVVGTDIVSARLAGVADEDAAADPPSTGATSGVAPGATPSMSANERKSGIQKAALASVAPALECPTHAGTLGVSGLMQSVKTLQSGSGQYACGAPPTPSPSSIVFNAPAHLPAEAVAGI